MKKTALLCISFTAAICLAACGDTSVSDSEPAASSQTTASAPTEQAESTSASTEASSETTTKKTTAKTETTTAAPTTEEKGQSENGNYEDPDSISAGLWLSTYTDMGGVRGQRYYEMHDDGTGICVRQDNGSSLDLTYTLEGTKLSMNFSNGDSTVYDVNFLNADLFTISAVNEVTEEWSWYSNMKLSELSFYTNEELGEMSRNYFNSSDGRGCGYTEVCVGDEDNIVVTLYEEDDNTSDIVNIYYLDRYTADGHDWDNAYIDLTSVPRW